MKKGRKAETVQLIPIDRITVINPRIRNRKSFKDIVENIGAIGLKKPDHCRPQGRAGRHPL